MDANIIPYIVVGIVALAIIIAAFMMIRKGKREKPPPVVPAPMQGVQQAPHA